MKEGLLQGRPTAAWANQMEALVRAQGHARGMLQEAAVLCHSASPALAIAANTHYSARDSPRKQWTDAARRYLTGPEHATTSPLRASASPPPSEPGTPPRSSSTTSSRRLGSA